MGAIVRVSSPFVAVFLAIVVLGGCGDSEPSAGSADSAGEEVESIDSTTMSVGELDRADRLAEVLVPQGDRAGAYLEKSMTQMTKRSHACVEATEDLVAQEACGSPEALQSYLSEDQRAFSTLLASFDQLVDNAASEMPEFDGWYVCVSQLKPPVPGLTRQNANRLVSEAVGTGTANEAEVNRCAESAWGSTEAMMSSAREAVKALADHPDAEELLRLADAVGF